MRNKILLMFLMGLIVIPLNAQAKNKESFINKDRIIIRTAKGYNKSLQSKIEKALGVKVVRYEKIATLKNNVYVVKTKNKISDFNKNVNKVSKIQEISRVHASYIYKVDPQTKMSRNRAIADNWHVGMVKADKMKDLVTTNNKVDVAVLDTGADENHIDFKDKVDYAKGYNGFNKSSDFKDDIGHGTHVSGLVGANNKFAVGKNINVVPVRVLSAGSGNTEAIVAGIDYAAKNNIKIINMSLGGDIYDELQYDALQSYSGLVVVAAGNEGGNDNNYPAAYNLDNIISVGSIDKKGSKSNFSNYSSVTVDVFAPGENIYSTCSLKYMDCAKAGEAGYDENQKVAKMDGTSMATPIVTGIAGTLLSDNPNLTTQELKNSIMNSASRTGVLDKKSVTGGYVDGLKALEYSRGKAYKASHFAKLDNGVIKLWGYNANGQIGNGSNNSVAEASPFIPTGLDGKVIKYYLTAENTYLITDKGNLYVSGKNNFNQLGQFNKNDSSVFVKFKKKSEAHFVTGLSFTNKLGLYDASSLRIDLKDNGSMSHYYKLGSNSFKLETEDRANTDNLQYITLKGQRRITTQLLNGTQVDNYELYEDEGYSSNEIISRRVVLNTATGKIVKTLEFDDYEGGFIFAPTKVTTISYNRSNIVLDKKVASYINNYYYNYLIDSIDNLNKNRDGMKVTRFKDSEVVYKYKSKKIVQSITTKYNSYGTLKTVGSQKPYREVRKYNSSKKLVGIHKAYYNASSKLSKAKLMYKAVYKKKNMDVYKYQYNSSMVLTAKSKGVYYLNGTPVKYSLTKYNKNKKVAHLDKAYKKGVRSFERLYKFSDKGTLKSSKNSKAYLYINYYKKGKLVKTERYTYDTKGKKTNKKVTVAKGGKK